jgi:hypothetical protein
VRRGGSPLKLALKPPVLGQTGDFVAGLPLAVGGAGRAVKGQVEGIGVRLRMSA